jgi:transcriptional regulator with XRE-family HTH domain
MAVMLECNVLKNARENLGLSAVQIASKANVSLRQYQRFESGERSLSASSFVIARRILEALELDISSFGKGNDNDSSGESITEYREKIKTAYASKCEVFKDKICVFIGRLERCSKQEAQDRVFAVGGIPQNNIAAFVSFVIAGKISESSKVYKTAKRYENHGLLTILSEQEFFDTLEGKFIPPETTPAEIDEGIPNIAALLNQKRAAFLASKKIIGADENLLDARSVTAVQDFVQKYMHNTIADQVRGHYGIIINNLEQGAELLLDTSGFTKKHEHGNGFTTGYNKTLSTEQTKAVVYAECFLESIDDSKCPVKLRKRRNSTANEHRADESQWMKAAAEEIRRKLNEEHDDDFWSDRNPLLLHFSRKKSN